MLESSWRRLISNLHTAPEASGSSELVTIARVSKRIRGSDEAGDAYLPDPVAAADSPNQTLQAIRVELVAQVHGIVIVDQHERRPDGQRVEPLNYAWMLVSPPHGTDVRFTYQLNPYFSKSN